MAEGNIITIEKNGTSFFQMSAESEMEKYRYSSFWQKEPETLSWLDSFKKADCFIDVGANIGVYTLYAAHKYHKMLIYAFEPMKKNYDRLWDNIVLNGFKNIIPFQWAVGARVGFSKFCSDGEVGTSGGQLGSGEKIQVVSVDTIISATSLRNVNLKIDIDGLELDVINGALNSLTYIKSILIEVSKKTKKDVGNILIDAGFSIDNKFNKMLPHSSERRAKANIDAENIVFTR